VANESPNNFGKNYMVDPNNVIFSANINVSRKQNILGLVAAKSGETRVYFSHVSVGTSITSSNNIQSAHARNYLVKSQQDTLDLKQILVMAGATVNNVKTGDEDFNLSPEKLDKSSIIGLLK
jgi:uridylate kinase